MNDLPNNVRINFFIYAGDNSILCTDNDYHYLLLSVKADFADAEEWVRANHLFLDCNMTHNVLVSLKGRPNSCSV